MSHSLSPGFRRLYFSHFSSWGFPGSLVIKDVPANAGDTGDLALIFRSGRSPGRGDGSPFQDSCLGNPMDRGTWQATAQGVTKSQPQRLSMHIFLLSDFLHRIFISTMLVNDCFGTVLILLLIKSSATCLVQFLQVVQGCAFARISSSPPKPAQIQKYLSN